MTDRARRRLWWVLALAAVVRLASLLQFASLPFFTHHRLDALLYHDMARAFASGDVLFGDEVLHMSPLYAVFLGLQYVVVGTGPWIPRLVQLALGLAIVWMVHDTVRRLMDERWALGAALAMALYGPLVFYEHQLHVSTVATAANTAVLWLAVRVAGGEERRRTWMALGLAWGLAILARPNALLLGLAVLPATMVGRRGSLLERGRSFALVAALGAACVLPVTVRNVVVAGELVPVTDSGGLNFYLGNGPGANGAFRIPPEVRGATSAQKQFDAFRAFAEETEGRALSAKEVDRFWYGRTTDHIARDPGAFAAVLGRKLRLYWNAAELSNTHDFTFHRELMPALWLAPVSFGWIAGLGLVGIGLGVFRRRPTEVVVAGFNLAACLALVIFFVLGHYRATFIPGLLVAAAIGARWLVDTWRAGQRGLAGLFGVTALALTVFATIPVFELPRGEEWRKLGFAYHKQRNLEEAAAAYEKAIEVSPRNLSAHKNLAILRHQEGDLAAATAGWTRVLELARDAGREDYVAEATEALGVIERQGRATGG